MVSFRSWWPEQQAPDPNARTDTMTHPPISSPSSRTSLSTISEHSSNERRQEIHSPTPSEAPMYTAAEVDDLMQQVNSRIDNLLMNINTLRLEVTSLRRTYVANVDQDDGEEDLGNLFL